MANVPYLPENVIYSILINESLSIKDVVNFSLTCKLLYARVNDLNVIWQHKFCQRWPALKQICSPYWFDKDMKEEIIERVKCRQKVKKYLSTLYHENYYKEDLSFRDMLDFEKVFCIEGEDSNILKHYYLVDEVNEINKTLDGEWCTDLTNKYYAKKVFMHLRKCHLKKKWQEFINLPAAEQISEWTASFISRWCKPQEILSHSYVSTSLDDIAQQALSILQQEHPEHAIFSVTSEQRSFWKFNMNIDNYWSKMETGKILEAIRRVMFSILRYHLWGNTNRIGTNGSKLIVDMCFIDDALRKKTADILTLLIIFESVARRLGVSCLYAIVNEHISLVWEENGVNRSDDESYYTINTMYNRPILERMEYSPFFLAPQQASAQMIVELLDRMTCDHSFVTKEISTILHLYEFLLMVNPENVSKVLRLVDIYKDNKMNLTDLITILKNIRNRVTNMADAPNENMRELISCLRYLEQKSNLSHVIVPQIRSRYVKYAVGMIVEICSCHPRLGKGVIIGWKMGPCVTYCVLLNDNKCSYRNSIMPVMNPKPIKTIEIGKYFSHFQGTHYIPNKKLMLEYPDDLDVANEYYERIHKSS